MAKYEIKWTATVGLKPCPFCGGSAKRMASKEPDKGFLWCDGCGVEMHGGQDGIPSCDESWNRRTPLPPVKEG